MSRPRAIAGMLLLAGSLGRGAFAAEGATASVELVPKEAGLGDPLAMRLVVRVPQGGSVERAPVGPDLGPFEVLSGSWSEAPEAEGSAARWVWSGSVAAYALGEQELPAIEIRVSAAGRSEVVRTAPVRVTLRGQLPKEGEKPPELADLKPPASIPPDWGPLRAALAALAAFLAAAAVAWWLFRRYAGRLAAVPAVEDPFRRLPPHEWAYEELRRLLDRRTAEGDDPALFYADLSRIVKQYLSGRFRIDLVERTTEEVPGELRQAGVSREASQDVRTLLEAADRVKFARESPDAAARRRAVDEAYRIVDMTKPAIEKGAA